ncbi:hypothetical protein GCM10010289_01110 [Streptomyces violascens]|nr:hypothetical protein GCM10010289_01110 [Streptomyces violascens]
MAMRDWNIVYSGSAGRQASRARGPRELTGGGAWVPEGACVDGAAAEEMPCLESGEGAFVGCAQSGVVAAELLVMLGLFAVAAVRVP